jgi:hypothetical protein
MPRKPRILVIVTNRWFSIGQFLQALVRVGFEVAILCPPGSPIEQISKLSALYKFSSQRPQKSIRRAIADWEPLFLICNDDVAVRELQSIHSEACLQPDQSNSGRLVNLIESSLGDRRSFATSRSKSRIICLAQELGVNCPPTVVFDTYKDVDRHLDRTCYPALIKLDESSGGRGIRLARSEHELSRAMLELSFPHDWPKSLRSLLARIVEMLPVCFRPSLPPSVSIQNYVHGRPANRAVLCWKGVVLAGITIEAIESDPEFGPTTLARIIEHPELTEAASKIVHNQNLSGFFGFDFVIDPANRAWFVEMNPRVTPACHLRFESPSLPAALFLQLTGELAASDSREVPRERIALFPNRISKEARSHPYFDDTPDGEPAFLEACRRSRLLRRLTGSMTFHDGAQGRFAGHVPNPVIPEGTNGT